MDLTLNLLPPQERAALGRQLRQQRIASLGLLLVGGLVILCLTVSGVWWQLSREWTTLQQEFDTLQTSTTRPPIASLSRTAREKIAVLQPLLAPTHDVPTRLHQLATSLPAGIHLTTLELRAPEGTAKLTGQADTRAQLLQLQDVLTNAPDIQSVDFPRAGLVQREDIPFTITIVFTPV